MLPLIEALGQRRPALHVLLTTGTVTSARSICARLPGHATHQFVPLDSPRLVARFLEHWKPSLAVFTEQEIWPNLIVESHNRNIPLALVNARMSAASFERWRKRPRLARALFARFTVVLAQNEAFKQRFVELGAVDARSVGNLKIDAPAPPVNPGDRGRLDAALAGRPRFVAASTHDGEEQIIAAAHRELARRMPGFITIIAPRHPERGPAVGEMLTGQGFKIAQRSLGELPGPRTDIYIADTIGELGLFYASTDVAFIGGSLISRGGQNPIEAVRHNAAVFTGPHWENFEDAYTALLTRNGAAEVRTAVDISTYVSALLSDPAKLDSTRQSAAAALTDLSGALARTLDEVLVLLPEPVEVARAP